MNRALLSLSLLLAFLAGPTAYARPTGLALVHLETDAAAQPLGIDDPVPRLSWAVESARRGVLQRAYRVLVASSPELLREGRADVWDSKQVVSSDPWAVYAGPSLKSRTRYYWTARAWASGGLVSDWARPAWFETALLDADEWKGLWIAGPERKVVPLTEAEGQADDALIRRAGEFCRPVGWLVGTWSAPLVKNNQGECRELRPAPMLRKSFRISKPVARARVYSSGLAYNSLTVNGRAASDALLDPSFTDYGKTVLYTTQDVTALLRQGENVVASELGSGHYDDATRTWDWGWEQAEWRGRPRLRLDLYVTYTDGSEQVISSDGTWKVSADGPVRYDSYYLGETYDARREIAGWDAPGFD
ncbi:MAG TPA: alpha-L-rhamnosidase N-terminal domain-containing protein, partial [Pyrinomonadaceae bacterium]